MDIQKHLERAQEAARKKNFDYAIALYQQVLAVKPDNGQARAELRQVLARKFEYKKPSALVLKAATVPQMMAIAAAKTTRKADNVARACEKYLAIDPLNVSINFMLAKALESSGHFNSAVAVYEFVAETDAKNTEALKRAGLLKYRLKDIQGALDLYEKVLAINPRDAEAEKMRKNLAAEGTLAKGSYATAGSSHELIKEKEEAAHLQRQMRIHKTGDEIEAEIEHLNKHLAQSPDDLRAQKELGKLFVKKKDFAAAKAHFEKMLEDDPHSFDLRCILGDLKIRTYTSEIDNLEARVEAGEGGAVLDDLKALKGERLKMQVQEYHWRVKEHPTDLGLWFQFGQYAFAARQVDGAIEAFQNSVKDPRHKISSLHMLGKAFLMKGLYDLALKQLETALNDLGGVTGKSKAILYDLGRVAEKKEDRETAMNWYLKIFEIDINYKDVASKIEALKQD